jgi:hypothetical protein
MTPATADGDGHSSDAPEATLISVILDRSGSMASVREPTIQGFNDFLEAQRQQNDGGRALMSLTQFDDRYEVNFVGEPIENIPNLDTSSYVPRSRTALYDAIGRTVHEMEAWIREHDWKERVLVLIVTDGQENASREYTFEAARALIEGKRRVELRVHGGQSGQLRGWRLPEHPPRLQRKLRLYARRSGSQLPTHGEGDVEVSRIEDEGHRGAEVLRRVRRAEPSRSFYRQADSERENRRDDG